MNADSTRCFVIIPAAGTGSRFGGDTPKQYLELRGKPLLMHSIDRFLSCDEVEQIVIAATPDQHDRLRSMVDPAGVAIVEGGATRAESVRNGVEYAKAHGARLVAIHDAVRPAFSMTLFRELLLEAEIHGGAIATRPIVETVHRVELGKIVATEDRTALARALTPQCFRIDDLMRAYATAPDIGSATDEAALVAKVATVRVLEGEVMNIKVTTPADLELLDRHYEEWRSL